MLLLNGFDAIRDLQYLTPCLASLNTHSLRVTREAVHLTAPVRWEMNPLGLGGTNTPSITSARSRYDGCSVTVATGRALRPDAPRHRRYPGMPAELVLCSHTVCFFIPSLTLFLCNDFRTFVLQAADLGLWVILHPGPYISSELDLGGLPR